MKINRWHQIAFLSLIFFLLIKESFQIITGTIEINSAQNVILQTSATYTFRLSSQQQFYQNGRLLIIFPQDFTFTSTQALTCADDSGTNLNCAFNYQARLVTITSGLKNLASFTFSISGITNPGVAVETGYFTFRSYQLDSGSYKFVENSDTTLTVTPQPGSLTGSKLYFHLIMIDQYNLLQLMQLQDLRLHFQLA
ncbi:UNKNOWN [Stylonychia lemnae]|uniref:Transmembrane protein n=1 Tax=Stylonychia lemnae TaxID=5949 RepID=A0A078ADE2_STYLE|nr:UNKNOWN [Stylonychia lemnae]|eukprot:CDW80260.1 UNKNOWN [Stylonychia lemnae]